MRCTRNTVTIHVDRSVYQVMRPENFRAITRARPPNPNQAYRVANAAEKPKRRSRKKSIKVRGRIVRRSKRPRKANQIRTIDIIKDPIVIPVAFLTPKEEMGKRIITSKK